MLKRIEHIAILLLVVVLPFGNILRFDFNNGISVLGIDIIASILLLSSIMKVFTIKYVVRKIVSRSGLVVPFLTIALLSAVVHVFSYPIQTMLIGIMYFVRLVLYFNIGFILLQKSKAELNKVLAHTLLSLTVFAGLGLTQYILFPDLRSLYYQGWDEHLYRVFGTLFDPNFSGVVYILGFFVACGFYLESKQKNGSFNNSSIYYAISSGICFTGLMLTYSRSSYIMFGMAVILLSFFLKKAKFLFVIGTFFVGGLMLLPKSLPSEGVNLVRTASVNSRLVAYQEATEIFLNQPVIGVGFNMYRYSQHEKGFLKENGNAQSWLTNHSGAGVPNSYLFVLATTGLTGFIALVYGLGRSSYTLFMSAQKKKSIMLYSILSAFGGLLTHALFENSLFYPFIVVYFILVSISAIKISS